MSDTVATDSVGVRWVLMAKWFFSPSSLSRFGSVRSSRWLGEEMKVDDPTEGFSSARETCQWMDGRTQGGRHKGLLGRRRGPSAPPTLPRSLFLSFYYTLSLYFSLFLSLSLSLYPPPPTYFSSWWWHPRPQTSGTHTSTKSVSWLNCLSLCLIPSCLDVTCATLLCTVLQKPLMWSSFVKDLSPGPLPLPDTPLLTPRVLMAAALSLCSLDCTAYFLNL